MDDSGETAISGRSMDQETTDIEDDDEGLERFDDNGSSSDELLSL